jgi:hypothetical protein
MDFLPLDLTTMQQFNLAVYSRGAKNLSREQAIETLLEVVRQLMVKDNVINHLMRKQLSGEFGDLQNSRS